MTLEETTQGVELGSGRSGTVFQGVDNNERKIAIKVFSGDDFLGKLVNYLASGAPNAYNWDEDAIRSAFYVREILKPLVPYWTDSKVRVAEAIGTRWNHKLKANETNNRIN